MKALNGYDISKLWEMFAVGDSQISSRGKKKGQKRKVKVNKIQTEENIMMPDTIVSHMYSVKKMKWSAAAMTVSRRELRGGRC